MGFSDHPKWLIMMGSSCRSIVALLRELLSNLVTFLGNGTGCITTAMGASLLLTSGLARCEAALHGCRACLVCLFYAIATVFQLYHGGDVINDV